MINDADYFRRQAETERANAAGASLENVRERCLRAAQSWDQMAQRVDRVGKFREANERARDVGDG